MTLYFNMENTLVTCTNINGLMESLNIEYKVNGWRFLIDSLELNLKAVLLHVGNELPSILIGHAIHRKEL